MGLSAPSAVVSTTTLSSTGAPTVTAPVILGFPMIGSAVAYVGGTTSGSPAPTSTFDVQINGVSKGPNYVPVAADEAGVVNVVHTVTNLAGISSATSSVRLTVLPAPLPLWTAHPQYRGVVGSSADAGEVDDPDLAPAHVVGQTYKFGDMVKIGSQPYWCQVKSTSATPPGGDWKAIGAVFYIAKSGADTNAGTKAAPWLSIARVCSAMDGTNGSAKAPGSSLFLFNRGDGTFSGQLLQNYASNGSHVIGAYGTGARPIVTPDVNLYFQYAVWSQKEIHCRNVVLDGANLYQMAYTAGVGVFAVGDTLVQSNDATRTATVVAVGASMVQVVQTSALPIASGAQFQTAGAAKTGTITNRLTANGFQINNGATGSICNFEVKNCIGEGIASPSATGGTYGLKVYNGYIHDCSRTGGAGAGLAGKHVMSETCGVTLYNNGDGLLSHNTYFGGNGAVMQGLRVEGGPAGGNYGFNTSGTPIGMRVADCVLLGNGNSIDFSRAGYAGEVEHLSNVLIERTEIGNSGPVQGMGIYIDTATNTVIRNCVFWANKLGAINVAGLTDTPVGTGVDDTPTADVYIYNNTINSNAVGTESYGVAVNWLSGTPITNLWFVNNVLYSPFTGGYAIRKYSGILNSEIHMGGNVFYYPNHASGKVLQWDVTAAQTGGTAMTPAEVSAVLGSSIGLVTDPGFVAVGTNDYRIAASSAIKTTGIRTGLTLDRAGNPRSLTSPTPGAYEYV